MLYYSLFFLNSRVFTTYVIKFELFFMTSSGFNAAPYNGYFNYCILIVKLTTLMKSRKKIFTGAVTFALEIELSPM